MGGEKLYLCNVQNTRMGSPPRGRGKGNKGSFRDQLHRITPAWAGKSPRIDNVLIAFGDHPRVGGEKFHLHLYSVRALGSPPRGRGKVSLVVLTLSVIGITPAWAGKSAFLVVGHVLGGDHPRVGGEKLDVSLRADDLEGSPPRGRGKDHGVAVAEGVEGITPAWAGKRPPFSCRSFR